jgi:hypothetical protein
VTGVVGYLPGGSADPGMYSILGAHFAMEWRATLAGRSLLVLRIHCAVPRCLKGNRRCELCHGILEAQPYFDIIIIDDSRDTR